MAMGHAYRVALALLACGLLACGQPFTSALVFGESGGAGGAGGQDDGNEAASAGDAGAGGDAGKASVSSASSAGGGGAGVSGVGGAGVGGAGVSTTSSAGAGGGEQACGPSTCNGCCDAQGVCQVGADDAVCGLAGEACAECQDACGWDPPGPDAWCGSGQGYAFMGCKAHACAPVERGGAEGACCFQGDVCVAGACQ